jgi:hypothetical protein
MIGQYLDDWPIFLSVLFFVFSSHGMYFLNVVFITCICNLYLIMYILFMYCYTLTHVNCIALHYFILVSCMIYLFRHSHFCDVLILTCFIFNCQLTVVGFVKRMYVRVYICMYHVVFSELSTVGKETVEHRSYSAA